MSWLNKLYRTYEYLKTESDKNPGSVLDLVPPCLITQNAQLTVVINENSEYVRAELVPKDDAQTMTPATQKSAVRTSKPEPHIIFDNLSYVAGDLMQYYQESKKGYDPYHKNFKPYLENLLQWIHSNSSGKYAKIVYDYLVKETLIRDLVHDQKIKLNSSGMIDEKIKHLNIPQNKYFIRFSIQENGRSVDLWKNFPFLNSYSEYYLQEQKKENQNDKSFCYATGIYDTMTELHGKYIRYPGDGAKLLSSNDSSNFTFRGKFSEPNEAYQISYEVSEKAHSALRYLIKKQAYVKNGLTILSWSDGNNIPLPITDSIDLTKILSQQRASIVAEVNTDKNFADELEKALKSFHNHLVSKTVNIMILDAATPGRMSLQYYKEFDIDDYLENILKWHNELSWLQHYKKNNDKEIGQYISAPSFYEICKFSFGKEQGGTMTINENDKYINRKLSGLFPCIIDGRRLPVDYMKSAYFNAINPVSKEYFNWRKCLDIACSLIKKYYIDRGRNDYNMALNKNLKERSYLYGRLLAVADEVETIALKKMNKNGDEKTEKRLSSAKRLMDAFSKKPYTTWGIISGKLVPYWNKLTLKEENDYRTTMKEIMDLMEFEDFSNNKALEPSFLLGYYNQSYRFLNDKNEAENNKKLETEDSYNDK